MRRYAASACRRTRMEREKSIEEWLTYWRKCEEKFQQTARSQRISDVPIAFPMTQEKAHTIARAMRSTPEQLKEQVVRELYHLLRLQHTRRAIRFWRRWFALFRRREELRLQLAEHPRSTFPHTSAADSINAEVQTMSLPTVNHAIFLMYLYPPRFDYLAGRDVKVQELVRLANKNMAPDFTDLGQFLRVPELRRAPATVLAFLMSPLCQDATWISKRYGHHFPTAPTPGTSTVVLLASSDSDDTTKPGIIVSNSDVSPRQRMPQLLQGTRQSHPRTLADNGRLHSPISPTCPSSLGLSSFSPGSHSFTVSRDISPRKPLPMSARLTFPELHLKASKILSRRSPLPISGRILSSLSLEVP
eukprot:GGOE01007622.1.p1 GENE.GGOE01007622.1~~GGOE01007622.1.p1  ORF type:complete len:360 (+),score=49.81 GGOE01007622.1:255-1334(+)